MSYNMASGGRKKRWDAETGTFVDDNDDDSKPQQSNRNPKNKNQRNQQGKKESKGENVQRGNSAQNNSRGNNGGRNDRRGQTREDGSGYDGGRGQSSQPPPAAYGHPPNYPPPSTYNNYPPNQPPPPMMQYQQNMPYGVARPIVQPVIYQTVVPPQMPMPHHPNQQGYFPPPMHQYGGPPPPYSPSDGTEPDMGYQGDTKNSKKSRQDGRQQQKPGGRQQDGRQQDCRQQDGRQQGGRQQQNKGGGGNDNNKQSKTSSRRNDSMGTDDGEDNRQQNNRGRGKEDQGQHQRQGRGKGGNNGSMQRTPSPMSVHSEGSTCGDGKQESDKKNNRGRGRQDGQPFDNRGRGRQDGPPFNNRGRGRQDGPPFDNRGRGRQDGPPFDNRGRGRQDGPPFNNRGWGRQDGPPFDNRGREWQGGPPFDNRGRGRQGGPPFENRGRGRQGGPPFDNRAQYGDGDTNRMPRNNRGRGRQDGELGSNRGRGGMPRNNRGQVRGRGNQQRFQGNRRGFRPPFRGGVGNRGRNSSVADSGEYSDCSASVVSDNEIDNGQNWFAHTGRNYPQRGPMRGAHRKIESLLNMLPQRDPIRNWNLPRRGRFGARWSGLATRRGNMRKTTESSDDFDDSVSMISEVSAFDDEPENGDKKEIEAIKLDDLFTISMVTLKNRLKRHKKKLSDMKKNKENPKYIEVYEMKVKLVVDAKEQREKSEKQKSNLTKKEKSEQIESSDDHDTSSDDTVHEVPVNRRNVNAALKRSHVVGTAKGRVSYQPQKNKKGKVSAKKTAKPLLGACKADSEEMSDCSDEYDDEEEEEEEEIVCRPKQVVTKKKPIEKKKHKASADNNDSEVIDEGRMEDEGAEAKKVSKKSRNRKKQGKKSSNSDHANESSIDSTDKQLLTDILGKLDNIILNEKKDKPYTKDSTHGILEEVDQSDDKDKDTKKQEKKTKKSNEKEERKGAKDFPKEERKVAKGLPKERKSSGSGDPDVNEVFKFMVKNLDGKGTPEEIVRESDLFPINFDAIQWFRKLRSRFNLLERNGNLELVFVFNRDASYCLDYIKNKSCDKPSCNRYHVCKNLLSGHCMYGADKCKYSHDMLDERNMKISKELGFNNVFTNEEICSILQVRFPHICTSWMENGTCSENGCYALHICPRFIYGKCLEGDSCQLIHDRTSEHNIPIINAYNMSRLNDGLFRKMVYVIRKGASDDSVSEPVVEEEGAACREGAAGGKQKATRGKQKTSVSEDSDIADNSSICMNHLVGNCKTQKCKCIHSNQKLPYIWQILLFGTWVTVDESEEVEKCFSDKSDFSNMIQLVHNEIEVGARIFFKPYIRGVANIAQPGSDKTSVEARRLSTLSYKQSTVENGFLTQWRWYWLDNNYQWNLFQPDVMQHTLESKFLAKQREYNYSREDYRFKYTISFDAMTQTNLEIGTSRDMVRRPLFVSSQDVEELKFPATLADAPNIAVPLPENWAPWDLANPFELVRLSETDPSYKGVSADFYKTLNPNQQKITDIFRVQNHKLWALFKNQEEYMRSNYQRVGNDISVDKRPLFHGTTTWNAVRGISINNFDMRVSGTHGTVYGDGAYFARDAKYSHNYTKAPQRLMFVASVLVGQYTKGDKSLRRPPEIAGSQHELYDSCVDNIADPKIFVLFDKNQFYPGYLIQYHDLLDAVGVDPQPIPPPRRGNAPGYAASSSIPSTNQSASSRQLPARPVSPPTGHMSASSSDRSQPRTTSGASFQNVTLPEQPPQKKKDDSCSIQ